MTLTTNLPLGQVLEHLFALYGARNRQHGQDLLQRAAFLNVAVSDLGEALRYERGQQVYAPLLARIFCRIVTTAEMFASVDEVLHALATKYPSSHCTYCGQSVCQCVSRRANPTMTSLSSEQLLRSLNILQEHGGKVYGVKNRIAGAFACLNRLNHEVSEIMGPAAEIPRGEKDIPEKIRKEIILEIADAIMWTIAMANLLDINLEAAVIARYGTGCWKCENNPCNCEGGLNTRCIHT